MMTSGVKKVFLTPLTNIYTTDKEGVGTLRFEGNKVYKWVQFSGTTAVTAGSIVCYLTGSGTNVAENIVDGANTALGAGVAQAAAVSGTVQYGWIQIEGPAVVTNAFLGSSPAAGNTVTTNGTTAGNVTLVTAVAQLGVGVIVDVTNKVLNCTFPW